MEWGSNAAIPKGAPGKGATSKSGLIVGLVMHVPAIDYVSGPETS